MLNVPTTLCKCDVINEQVSLFVIAPVDDCELSQCNVVESTELVPIINTLCPCFEPKQEPVVNFKPEYQRTIIVKSCFSDFIKNITSTKFCRVGPSCQVS